MKEAGFSWNRCERLPNHSRHFSYGQEEGLEDYSGQRWPGLGLKCEGSFGQPLSLGHDRQVMTRRVLRAAVGPFADFVPPTQFLAFQESNMFPDPEGHSRMTVFEGR